MQEKLFKYVVVCLLVSGIIQHGWSQGTSSNDTAAVWTLLKKAGKFYFNNPDSSFYFAQQALALSRELDFTPGEAASLNTAGEASRFRGDLPLALELQMAALPLMQQIKNRSGEISTLTFIGSTYNELMEHRQGLHYLLQAKQLNDKGYIPGVGNFMLSNIGYSYLSLGMIDSALWYQRQAYGAPGIGYVPPLKALILRRLGETHFRLRNHDSAFNYYYRSLQNSQNVDASNNLSYLYLDLAVLHHELKNTDSAFYYARKSITVENNFLRKRAELETTRLLTQLHKDEGRTDSILYYLNKSIALNDSLYGPDKYRRIQLLILRQQQEQQRILQERQAFKSRTRTTLFLCALGFVMLIALILLRNNRQKQKARLRIEKAYEDLKSTQQQLIQSEKMASLGELTAGIAHEIQNPLNFVNNFSEINNELIEELKNQKSKLKSEEIDEMLTDISQNNEKINHHGKRADAIVKGMLQHSRSSTGQKEPTNINALADEYLRLAYHGLRAKDKSFDTLTKTDFDTSIEKINVVPQEIGRVILNLINNAFYAVSEKQKQNLNEYEPSVSVSTKKINGKVEISVKDNGNGIPQKVVDKIFQPFFTTKPTGQGTGLGLSLAYDIVKAHGGELKVETKEGEGSDFIIQLSTNQ